MTAPSPLRIAVVGGGISGLAAAWRIRTSLEKSSQPFHLQLLEASPRLGGSIQSTTHEGFLLESGPDCFISEKPRGVGLCRELRLEGELIGTRPECRRSFIFRNESFHAVPEGFYLMGPSRFGPFLRSRLLSWPGKFRAMLEPLLPARPQTDESLGSFVRRRFGREMLEWMAQPLIAGIYGADPEDLSLRATFPRFLELERNYGSVVFGLQKQFRASRTSRDRSLERASGARYSLFMTLQGGLGNLVEAIKAKLGPDVIACHRRVTSIRHAPTGWQIVQSDGHILEVDALCLALPSYALAEILRELDPELASELAEIPYAPAATANFGFLEEDVKRPLPGIGFVVPSKEKRLVLGCTLAHNKFEGRAPKGKILIRVFLGGTRGGPWNRLDDTSLIEGTLKELSGWLDIQGKPLFAKLSRYHRALPQYIIGHLPKIARIDERVMRHDHLALAGNWALGIGIPDCIESGERAAERLLKRVQSAQLA